MEESNINKFWKLPDMHRKLDLQYMARMIILITTS